jgi:hypothetical protein
MPLWARLWNGSSGCAPRRRSGAAVGLIRSLSALLARPITDLPRDFPAPGPDGANRSGRISQTRADELDYFVGVDTHRDQNVLGVVVVPTRAVIAQRSVAATARGYAPRCGSPKSSCRSPWSSRSLRRHGTRIPELTGSGVVPNARAAACYLSRTRLEETATSGQPRVQPGRTGQRGAGSDPRPRREGFRPVGSVSYLRRPGEARRHRSPL